MFRHLSSISSRHHSLSKCCLRSRLPGFTHSRLARSQFSSVWSKASQNSSRTFAKTIVTTSSCAAMIMGLGVVLVNLANVSGSENIAAAHEGNKRKNTVYIQPSSHSSLKIFSGNGNRELAREVASLLGVQIGRMRVRKFADGEINIRCHDNVRGKDVFLIQPTCAPANDNLMELLLMISCLRRASAKRIVAVIPYYSYSREHRQNNRDAIAGADVALMLETMGVDAVVSVDVHNAQMQGFFGASTPMENLQTISASVPYFVSKKLHHPVVVSPCGSSVVRARKFRNELERHGVDDCGLAMVAVQGVKGVDIESSFINDTTALEPGDIMEVVGNVDDLYNRDVIIVDDLIDSGNRITKAAEALNKLGTRRIYACCTHGLFTNNAIDNIEASPIDEVVVFNTIPLPQDNWSARIRQLSIAGLLAECIRRMHHGEPLDALDGAVELL